MNASDSATASSNQQNDCQAGTIISVDGGPITMCIECRDRVAIPCQYYCTECIEPGLSR